MIPIFCELECGDLISLKVEMMMEVELLVSGVNIEQMFCWVGDEGS